MEAFLTLTRPILFFMRRSGGMVLRLFGAQATRRGGAVHSPDELKLIVTASRQFGQIPEFQEEMIHSAIELDSITVREVMVARPDIFSLPSDLMLDEALVRVVEGQHSRIPVYEGSIDQMLGFVHVRDMFELGEHERRTPKIRELMRPIRFVPETKAVNDLMREMQQEGAHMVIVVDE